MSKHNIGDTFLEGQVDPTKTDKTKNLAGLPMSKLLRMAVDDARKLNKDPAYELDMAVWHAPGRTCSVCMAGAVMVCRLRAKDSYDISPYSFPESETQLYCINAMRAGEFLSAASTIGITKMTRQQRGALYACRHLVDSHYKQSLDGGRAPWHVYIKCVKILEAVGL